MMKTRLSRFLPVLVVILLFSCNSINKAHFWEDFEKDKQVNVYSDHGPWGGVSRISWSSDREGDFRGQDIIDFAGQNGWELTDSLHYPDSSLHIDVSEEGEYFDQLLSESLSGSDTADKVIFVFKTGMIAVRPGNDGDTDRNGFVVINKKGTHLNVFYRWGE